MHNASQNWNSCKTDNGSQNAPQGSQSWNSGNNHQNISQAQFSQLMAMMSNLQTSSKSTDQSGAHNNHPYSGGLNIISGGPTGQAFTTANCSGIKACSNCVCCSCWSAVDYTWIIDTGASDHMCHNENLFIQTQIFPKAYHVTLPNGHVVNVHKVGSVRIHLDIILHNVLHVPQFKYNLLSIGKLCKQAFSYAIFTNSKCYFQGPSMKRPLELGDIHSGLYLLQHFPASQLKHNTNLLHLLLLNLKHNTNLLHLMQINVTEIMLSQTKLVI